MTELLLCPFCGSTEEHYTISFKKNRRKVNGIYYEICTINCDKCTCSIRQAGATREIAKQYAIAAWNRRTNVTQDDSPARRGIWAEIDDSYWRCKNGKAYTVTRKKFKHDACGKVVLQKENFCPNCGADMRENT